MKQDLHWLYNSWWVHGTIQILWYNKRDLINSTEGGILGPGKAKSRSTSYVLYNLFGYRKDDFINNKCLSISCNALLILDWMLSAGSSAGGSAGDSFRGSGGWAGDSGDWGSTGSVHGRHTQSSCNSLKFGY